MKKIIATIIFLESLLTFGQTISTLTTVCSQNGFTYSGNPGQSSYPNSGSQKVYVESSTLYYYRWFLKFDISSIPPQAKIISATIQLTPSGTENVSTTQNTAELVTELCNADWTELNLKHSLGISNVIGINSVTTSNFNSSTNKRVIDVTQQAQAIVEGRVLNFGWRIRRNPETTATGITKYAGKMAAVIASRPTIVIQYYTPVNITNATINHPTGVTSANGSIALTVQKGSAPTMNYEWYNSAGTVIGTNSNTLSGQNPGWYGVKIYKTGTYNDGYFTGLSYTEAVYYSFILVKKCDINNISYNPGPNYIDDAVLIGPGSGYTDNYQVNFGTNAYLSSAEVVPRGGGSGTLTYRSLLKFRMWADPQVTYNSATLTVYGNGHNPSSGSNASKLNTVTSNWTESGVAYSNMPSITTTNQILIPNIPTGNGNTIQELKPFFDTWKTNNDENYGLLLQLQTYTGSQQTTMQFNSSDAASNWPSISFNLTYNDVNTCDFTSYAKFSLDQDGGYTQTYQGKLKYQFNEELDQNVSIYDRLTLYDAATSVVKGAISATGTQVGSYPLLPANLIEFDHNQKLINLSSLGLTSGNFYVLELTLLTGERKYIKFKYL